MNVQLRAKIVDRAAKLIPHGFTPHGAVVASLYYYRQSNLNDVKSLIRAVRAKRVKAALEGPLAAQAPHWQIEEDEHEDLDSSGPAGAPGERRAGL